MKIWISTWIKPLIVSWRYEMSGKGDKIRTICTIRAKGVNDANNPGRDVEFEGIAYQHPRDAFDKERGRKLSLARAMQNVFTRDERREVWDQYFGRFTD